MKEVMKMSQLTSLMGSGLSRRGDDGKLPEFGSSPQSPNERNIHIPIILRVAIMIGIICFFTILCIALLYNFPDNISSYFLTFFIVCIAFIITLRGFTWIRS
jgi:hypothetical protein